MATINCRPRDSRCSFVAQLIRTDTALPDMRAGRIYLPGEDVRRRTVDLQEGEWLVTGEARHHKKFRGWDYIAYTVDEGKLLSWRPGELLKEALKVWVSRGPDRKFHNRKLARGIPPRGGLMREHMRGAGDQAALLRLIVADRRGVSADDLRRTIAAFTRRDRMAASSVERAREAERLKLRARQAAVEAAREQERRDAQAQREMVEAGMASFMP